MVGLREFAALCSLGTVLLGSAASGATLIRATQFEQVPAPQASTAPGTASEPVAAPAAEQPAASPLPIASAPPAAEEPVEPAAPQLPPAGIIPAQITIGISGSPAAEPGFLSAQIQDALDRQIRPTLRPGASVTYGPVAPWPLLPLAAGDRTTIDVTVTIEGDATSASVRAVTAVAVYSVPIAAVPPAVLFLSDDPEYLQTDGLVFRGEATLARPARLYYYHSDFGSPRDVDVVLMAATATRVQIIASAGGPDLDVMSVGHTVSRDFLHETQYDEGTVVDLRPGVPFVVRHALVLAGEVIAGTVDTQVVSGGPVDVSVVAAPAGSSPEAYLGGPRVPYDGHRRHGVFDISTYGAISASFTVGAATPAAVEFGGRAPTPHNLTVNDDGHDYGDFGVTRRITFTLVNPTDTPQLVYLYEQPHGGPVRGSFIIDGQLRELSCVRLPQQYALSEYRLPPHYTGVSTVFTMADGGSFYPVEIGATDVAPISNLPPVGTADGCSPKETAFPAVAATAAPSVDTSRAPNQ